MTFWLVSGLMTAAAIVAVLWPLWRRNPEPASDTDLVIYRDQLAEIDRDLAQGGIAPAEAEAARIEVSRRLIAAADRAEKAASRAEADTSPAVRGTRTWRFACAAVLITLPFAASAFYLTIGSPGLPGQPLADRLARANAGAEDSDATTRIATLASMVKRVEAHLERNPDDGRGWEVVAPVYMQFGRHDDAVKAWRNAIRLLGASADRLGSLGEAMVTAAGGTVTPGAKAAFERALKIDREHLTASLYLGLAARQAGDGDEARRIWEGMLARAPDGAEWTSFVRHAIAALGDGPADAKTGTGEPASTPGPSPADARTGTDKPAGTPGPSPADAKTGTDKPAGTPGPSPAAELTSEQRDMARGMVERLAARLAENGSSVEDWLRLVRSYLVLGEPDKARSAASDARRALAGDASKLQRLDSGVKALGVEG